MVQTARPVNTHLVQTLVKARGGVYRQETANTDTQRSARVHRAEIVDSIENGVVRFVRHGVCGEREKAKPTFLHGIFVAIDNARVNVAQKINIILRVKALQLLG